MPNKSSKKKDYILFTIVLVTIIVVGICVTFCRFETTTAATEVEEWLIIDGDVYITDSTGKFPVEDKHCLSCHDGIEPTRPHSSAMMQQIYARGAKVGDPNGCVVCHGGDPTQTSDLTLAHSGAPIGNIQSFYTPVPGSLHVNENTCGLCHEDHTYNVRRSLMNTDAGKIKTITWSWGFGLENKDHIYGNHAIDDPDGVTPRVGSDVYKDYMREMAALFPGQYPTELKQMPEVDLSTLADMPEQAAFTYLRSCNSCHVSGKGGRGYRGMGCAACHSLYSSQGYYEGGDRSIPHDERGHLLVHSMQGSRKSPIHVNDKRVTGIQTSTCTVCHASGRRIGTTYQGFVYGKYIRDDAHHSVSEDGRKMTGLSCADCHTTTSMHGNGNIGSTTLATIEIECSDCHGTPERYPWKLPIGYGDEFGRKVDMSNHRGVADEPEQVTKDFGVVYPRHDGYVLTARGNAFGNVVRAGNDVWLYTDQGLKIKVPVLKNIHDKNIWQNAEKAKVAMVSVPKHLESLECYACHSTWGPQTYKYQYGIDYRRESTDWVSSAASVQSDGTSGDYDDNHVTQIGGSVSTGGSSHSRWENLALGINGEGRVTPLTAVIQTVGSVIDQNGDTVLFNHIPKTADGVNAMEMQPFQPHSASRAARDCSDCHGNPQAIGYGVDNGYDNDPSVDRYTDVMDLNQEPVSEFTSKAVRGIKDLQTNFTQILSKDGRQLMTVDSHWDLSSPLTPVQRDKLNRSGVCMSCHQSIPDGSIPMRMLKKISKVANMSFADGDSHSRLLDQNNILMAWIKFIGVVVLFLLPFICIALYIYRSKIATLFCAVKTAVKKRK